MAFPKYIAWLAYEDGSPFFSSVATGGRSEVEIKARTIAATELWQSDAEGRRTILRITTYGKQAFVTQVVIGNAVRS